MTHEHAPGGCCTVERQEAFLAALLRVKRTGSPAGRSALRDARLNLEGHGEAIPAHDTADAS
jgi:hypothetical protein